MPKWSEVLKAIKEKGCKFQRNGKGSAEMWINREGVPYSIHPHKTEEIAKGTLAQLKKWAGLK